MAIAPYQYGTGAAPTPAATKPVGNSKIAPFKYAAAPVAPKPGLSADEQALVNKVPAPAAATPQTTFSLKPTIPKPFAGIQPAPKPVSLQAPLLPGVDLTNLNGKNALDSGFGENEPLAIKAPFVDKGVYTANDVPNQAIGGLVEWPERLVRSIGQYIQSLTSGGKYTAQDPNKSNFTAQTTLEATTALNDQLTQNGLTPTQAAWISGLYGVSSGALDLLGLEGILNKGVAKIAAQSALTSTDVRAAKALLGDPANISAAETSYRNLQKLSHPDMPGANAKLSTQASDAIRVLRQADKEGLLGTVARGAQQAQKPISEVLGRTPATPKKPVALIPEKTGASAPEPIPAPKSPGIVAPEPKAAVPAEIPEKVIPLPESTIKPFDYGKSETPAPAATTKLRTNYKELSPLERSIVSYKMDAGGAEDRSQMASDIISDVEKDPVEAKRIAKLSQDNLQDSVGSTIYRAGGPEGLSWTFDKDVADRFREGGQEVHEKEFTKDMLDRVIFYDGIPEKQLGFKWKAFQDDTAFFPDGFPFQPEDEILLRSESPRTPKKLTLKPEDLKAPVKERAAQLVKENLNGREMLPEFQKQAEAKAEQEAVDKAKEKVGGRTSRITKSTDVVEAGGKTVMRPAQLITKSELRGLVDSVPGKKMDFDVIEKDGKKFMQYEKDGTKMLLRPSALGLVEDNLKTGDTIHLSKDDLKAPGTSIRAVNEEGGAEASLANDLASGEVNPAKSIDEIKQRIDQLNKFGQSKAILRRTGGLPKKAAGMFRYPLKGGLNPKGIPERGQVHLQDHVVNSPQQYVETLAHELGHALEFTLTGATNKDTFRVFGKDLTDAEKTTIRNELKAITNKMVGEETAKSGAGYYYKNTELLARFLEDMFVKPGDVAELAPTALKYFEESAIETPIVDEYLQAVRGEIDKGQVKHVLMRDARETFMKPVEKGGLGKTVGNMAWNDIVRYRAMKERAKVEVEKFVKSKFKDVKDDPETLFRAVESIKVTEGDDPVFGTRDFVYTKSEKEAQALIAKGWKPVLDEDGKIVTEIHDGEQSARFAKPRYSPAEAKRIFDSLSPEGQKLVKDFTAARDEAKDYFNREVIKDVHNIKSDLEGWIHHYYEEEGGLGLGGDKIKTKKAAAAKQRSIPGKGSEKGAVEDLQKALTKALTELETTKAYNAFIEDFFARVSRPIAEGEEPMPGYVEVAGNVRKSGIGRPNDVKKIIIEDGKGVKAKNVRYQMPTEIYKRFQMVREVAVEASTAARVMNSLNRYWRTNILFQAGSAATNMVSGGLQFSTKVFNDFYREALTGDAAFPQTKRNIFAMLTVNTPKGWQSAPDWIYGGDMSNWYGEFGSKKTPGIQALDKNIDKYADRSLKLYGSVERYWKKVISIAEDSSSLGSLGQMTMEGLRLPTEEEKALLDEINKEVDLFAYDYDNVPNWLENHQQSAFGQAVKPFVKYPYKYAKQVTGMIQAAFDRSLPWQDRMAKILALSTIMGIYAVHAHNRKNAQLTPEVSVNAPPSVSTRGRLFIGTDADGNEKFTRVAKYPFLNITEAGMQIAEGHFDTANQLMNDMIGSVSPIGDIGLALLGYGNQYQTYQPLQSRVGQDLATFVPGSRMLVDIARFFDPYQRKQTTFLQGFTSMYPTTDEALQEKLHGDIKTIQVPLENGITPSAGEGTKRTTTDMFVRNYKNDILLGDLAGLYITRINPNVAEAFNTRDAENKAAAEAKAKKAELQKLAK